MDADGQGSCLTLTAGKVGSTPKALFEEAIREQQHVPVVPGAVVRLREGPDAIEPGYFVFLGDEKSEMVLSRAGEDEDGELTVTDQVHWISVDYRDRLRIIEMRVELLQDVGKRSANSYDRRE